ncbi:polysaccharide biosynthesis/export family protein [Methylobacterium durans]|uniref:polysaccharide biosynthesis/export family protein n=1 Tax=Methylobacterium durans TaxID=2202825 RepID=UPI002AFF0621|nr:polysaccharide biosynthesis/export family protein [Methylobacterium durans]MEA1832104.1 polysaccharide biosynthesis/export family protein [Methylobacterium durans]
MLRWTVLVLGLLLSGLGTAIADYGLGAQDRVRIRIVEWRPGKSEAIEWLPLNGEYTVAASGIVSVPMLGEFRVEGLSPSAFSEALADRLQKRAGFVNKPDVSVEVIQYRPFYIVGAVDKPGEYYFRPGTTVLQAVGIAGGLYRPADGGLLRLERDRITAVGLVDAARLDLQRGLIRKSRLEAELAGRTTFDLPEGVSGREAQRSRADEMALAQARAQMLAAQIDNSAGLQAILSSQVRSLEQKIAVQDKQLEISRRELKEVSGLVGRGLAVTSREFSLERIVAEMESKRLDFEMAALNARQDIKKSEQSATDLRNDLRTRIVTDLADTVSAIEQARAKLRTAEDLITEASVVAPRAMLDRQRGAQGGVRPGYTVIRKGRGSAISVDETAALEPGDVLRVELTVQPGSTAADERRDEAAIR